MRKQREQGEQGEQLVQGARGKHRKPKALWPHIRTAATLAMAGTAATTSVLTETGHAATRPTTEQVKSEVADLYRQAEQATQQYDGVTADAVHTRTELAALQDELARRTESLNRSRDQLGALAAARYRSDGIDPAMQLIVSSNPAQYLEKTGMLSRAHNAEAAELTSLATQQRAAQQLRDKAAADLAALSATQRALAADRRVIDDKLARARHLLDELTPSQAAGIASADGSVAHPLTVTDVHAPNARAAKAVAFAFKQLGKAYVWGATGPDAYDCSGLAQAAWAAAGVALPRTTYSQINAGIHVPESQLQPGDLVFFYSGISHVGIYIGDDEIIHAPRPGAPIRIASLSEMPFAGATRPA
ncbi:MAG: C40 family peptidase [Streptomycetaceae bacterium]|nr:C40 family peptidase [Streptomycetaceae bacterium]